MEGSGSLREVRVRAAVAYPSLSEFFTEVKPGGSAQKARRGPQGRSAIVITTKNHSDRLSHTLSRWSSLGIETILLDDSTTSAERGRSMELARESSVLYHGIREQRFLLRNVPVPLRRSFISPLGSPGWTLGKCRNYSLLVGLGLGYERLLLVDDDILPVSPSGPLATLALLDRFEYVGARTEGFPDDSVVGHLARGSGVVQYDFITGQYLAVRSEVRNRFFPDIYNEDLIFLLQDTRKESMARCGTVRQLTPPNPNLTTRRALIQEPGEIYVEGLIHAARSTEDGLLNSHRFWAAILRFRRTCLEELLRRKRVEASTRDGRLLCRVLDRTRRMKPATFARFHERYVTAQSRWVTLQSRVVHRS
jgi:hypothetical protein